ncbi:MAG: nuclear transport factor 2 family protein [Deltaproteobacteria bacterium]|nr:nuclear transport factor 2 family protein [Deltaproteobacteria bacterium]
MKKLLLAFGLAVLGMASSPLHAQSTPESTYAEWVKASKVGDIDAMLALSSKSMVDEFNQDYAKPEKKAEIQKLMKLLAPVSYKIREQKISKDGNSASLLVDAVALDLFKMGDPKAKPEKENVEVKLVKEGGQWKMEKQCNGKDGCGKEPEWTPLAWGGTIKLPDGTVKVTKGKNDFQGSKVAGKAFAVDLTLNFPETGSTLSYFLHGNPNLSDNYAVVDGHRFGPIAFAEDYPPMSNEKGGREVTVVEKDYSYSKNRNFQGKGTVSLLFDLPKDAKDSPVFYLQFTYGDKKYEYEVK